MSTSSPITTGHSSTFVTSATDSDSNSSTTAPTGFGALIQPEAGAATEAPLPISTLIKNHLENADNKNQFTFSHGGAVYTISKNGENYELSRTTEGGEPEILDSDVQIDNDSTLAGFIELGGISSGGSRVYIGYNPDGSGDIVAFVAEDLDQSDGQAPVLTESNSRTIFDAPPPADASAVDVDVDDEDSTGTAPADVNLLTLDPGNYTSDGTQLLDSAEVSQGLTGLPPGEYFLDGDGGLFRQFTVDPTRDHPLAGSYYLPADPTTGKYTTVGPILDLSGNKVVIDSQPPLEVTDSLLSSIGVPTEQIKAPAGGAGTALTPVTYENLELWITYTVKPSENGDNLIFDPRNPNTPAGTISYPPGDYFRGLNGGLFRSFDTAGVRYFVPADTSTGLYLATDGPIYDSKGGAITDSGTGQALVADLDTLNKLGVTPDQIAAPTYATEDDKDSTFNSGEVNDAAPTTTPPRPKKKQMSYCHRKVTVFILSPPLKRVPVEIKFPEQLMLMALPKIILLREQQATLLEDTMWTTMATYSDNLPLTLLEATPLPARIICPLIHQPENIQQSALSWISAGMRSSSTISRR